MHVDLSPLVSLGVQVLGGVLLAVASVAAGYVAKHFKLANESTVRGYLMDAAENAVAYAASKEQALSAEGKFDVTTKNAVIGTASDYLLDHVPDAIAKFNLDRDHVERIVEAKLGQLVNGAPTVSGLTMVAGPSGTVELGKPGDPPAQPAEPAKQA